jgi:hypothetical protein
MCYCMDIFFVNKLLMMKILFVLRTAPPPPKKSGKIGKQILRCENVVIKLIISVFCYFPEKEKKKA